MPKLIDRGSNIAGDLNLYLGTTVRELDHIAIEEFGLSGLSLMKRAASTCVAALDAQYPQAGHVAVFLGSGNNAADGCIVAGLLAARKIKVTAFLIGRVPIPDTDAAAAYSFCLANGVAPLVFETFPADVDVVVDALLGTGISEIVRDDYRSVIDTINASGLPVLSVDLPSGLCGDTGRVLGACVRADVTVTFIGQKLGLYTNNGPEYCGEIILETLGIPATVLEQCEPVAQKMNFAALRTLMPKRHRNAHKVRHGHLLVVGGDATMGGAVSMAAEAALFSGAGMVSVATAPQNVAPVIIRRPEIMARGINSETDLEPMLRRATAVVMGPGLGRGPWSQMVFNCVLETGLPLVIDADALNMLAERDAAGATRDNCVLTPHPGEASRLLFGVDIRAVDIQADRLASIRALHRRFGGVVLLKGSGTLIQDPAGDVSLCPYGNPGMSVAGMGDILSGVIGGLIVQGMGVSDAVRLGVSVHSLAADCLVLQHGELGLLATELLPEIRRLLNSK